MVKCADCGFLAVRSKVNYSLGEATIDFREKGTVAIGYDDKGMNPHALHELMPLCFASQSYLRDEIKRNNKDKNKNQNDEIKRIINQEINCKGFTEWKQGFTPKEHREMLDRQWERRWHIIVGVLFVILAGLFTLLGAFIANG